MSDPLAQRVEILGTIGADPAMGVIKGYAARVFFIGDTNGIENVPQPFVNNLMSWAF